MFNIATIWLILGVLLLLSEFLIPGFTIFFFGVGGLITSLVVYIIEPLQDIIWLQILIFALISIITLITLRKHFNTSLKGDIYKERDDYTGKTCKVIETVKKEIPGRIKYQGTTWSALSEEKTIKKGQEAIIIGKKSDDAMVFIIKQIKKGE